MSDLLPLPHLRPEVLDFLATRRSSPAPSLGLPLPEGAVLDAILTAAIRVPDHGKLAPWRIVLHGPQSRAQMAALTRRLGQAQGRDPERVAKAAAHFENEALIVAVLSTPVDHEKIPLIEQQLSAGACAMQLVNAAMAQGFGANWLTGFTATDPDFLAEVYDLAAPACVAGFVHIGTPRQMAPERPRPVLGDIVSHRD